MVWPFKKKHMAQLQKSAAMFFSPSARKSGLNGAAFDKIANDGYAESVVAYSCINRIAAAISSVEVLLYRKDKKGNLAKLDSHPLLDLIYNPNPTQSWREFIESVTAYHQLSGNAFVFGNGADGSKVRELQVLNSGKVRILPSKGFFPEAYEYRPDSSSVYKYTVDQLTGKSPIMHIKTFNPLNQWGGLSPIEPAAAGIDFHSLGQRWNVSLISNGARPSGALKVSSSDGMPAALTEDQYKRLQSEIDEQYTGTRNTGRPMLLEGGLEWVEMSINPKDMDFLEGKHSAARDIALAFGVPPQLLGIPGDSTYSNYSEAKSAFWIDKVLPLLGSYLDAFNRWLVPMYGDGLYLWYDEAGIPALEPMRNAKATRVNAATYMTINEKRREMGLDDIAGGETVFVQASTIPLEMAGVIDLPEQGSPADRQSQQ